MASPARFHLKFRFPIATCTLYFPFRGRMRYLPTSIRASRSTTRTTPSVVSTLLRVCSVSWLEMRRAIAKVLCSADLGSSTTLSKICRYRWQRCAFRPRRMILNLEVSRGRSETLTICSNHPTDRTPTASRSYLSPRSSVTVVPGKNNTK